MISKKAIILFLLVLVPTSVALSQNTDSLLLDSLVGGSSSFGGIATDDEEEEDIAEEEEKPLSEPDFIDEDYGYTGGRSFVTPPQSKFFDEPLKYFGYEFFIDAPTTFTQLKNTPVPPDYIVGPQDNINIILFGGANEKYDLTVTRDGAIFFPEIGPILVAGLPFEEVQALIKQTVSNQLIGTQASVTLGSLRSIDIFVVGEAYKPGMYSMSALSTLTNAIIKSGGIATTGSLRNIQVKRRGEIIGTFDFYDLLLNGDTKGDIRLMQGDVLLIPPVGKTVGINGAIGRPAIYELKNNETLKHLISFAGKLKPKADILAADIKRIDPSVNGYRLIPVDLSDDLQEKFALSNGDVLGIYPIADNLKTAILLSGHVKQPGFTPWKEGMRISELLGSNDDLLAMTDIHYILVKREDDTSQQYHFIQVNLEEVFQNLESSQNIVLNEKDEIILFPSLLTPDQITTKLIQDEYILLGDQMIPKEDEWTSMTYLRKSLMDERKNGEEILNPFTGKPDGEVRRYYEYSIYEYCSIPQELAVKVIESFGYSPKKTIAIDELENVASPGELKKLQEKINANRDNIDKGDKNGNIVRRITELCRNQLLEPLVDIVNRQISPSQMKRTISVFGNVHFPGIYPLTDNMNLRDSINAAGGLKDATYESEIELSRSTNAGKNFAVSNSFAKTSDNKTMSLSLQAMDVVNIKQISTKIKTVSISGEVFFAGTYPIAENQTLSELVDRAGGVKESGSLAAANFQRESLKNAEEDRLKKARDELTRKVLLSSQAGGLGQTSLDNDAIKQLTSLIVGDNQEESIGRLVINLNGIISGSIPDIMLEDGDKLHIPKTQQSISVIGEVFVSNSHLYQDNHSIKDYINLSGGLNSFADENNIYLIKADGSIVSPSQLSGSSFFRKSSKRLEPGDTIVVPLEVQPFNTIRATTEITQIIYQMALAAAAVNSF